MMENGTVNPTIRIDRIVFLAFTTSEGTHMKSNVMFGFSTICFFCKKLVKVIHTVLFGVKALN
jgi:hypothetical protein